MKHLTRTALVLLCVLCLAALTAGCGASPDEEPAASAAVPETSAETTTSPTASETTAPTTAPTAPDSGTGYCAVDSLVVRGGPGTDYYGIGGLKYGERVEILGREGDWFRIAFKTETGDVGYVSAQYIQGEAPTPTTAAVATGSSETTADEASGTDGG